MSLGKDARRPSIRDRGISRNWREMTAGGHVERRGDENVEWPNERARDEGKAKTRRRGERACVEHGLGGWGSTEGGTSESTREPRETRARKKRGEEQQGTASATRDAARIRGEDEAMAGERSRSLGGGQMALTLAAPRDDGCSEDDLLGGGWVSWGPWNEDEPERSGPWRGWMSWAGGEVVVGVAPGGAR